MNENILDCHVCLQPSTTLFFWTDFVLLPSNFGDNSSGDSSSSLHFDKDTDSVRDAIWFHVKGRVSFSSVVGSKAEVGISDCVGYTDHGTMVTEHMSYLTLYIQCFIIYRRQHFNVKCSKFSFFI